MSDTATPTETAKTAQTGYRVLLHIREPGDNEGYWVDQGVLEAHSAEHAIRQFGQEGRFVAVPTRSWKPVTVKAQTKTTLELKPAS